MIAAVQRAGRSGASLKFKQLSMFDTAVAVRIAYIKILRSQASFYLLWPQSLALMIKNRDERRRQLGIAAQYVSAYMVCMKTLNCPEEAAVSPMCRQCVANGDPVHLAAIFLARTARWQKRHSAKPGNCSTANHR